MDQEMEVEVFRAGDYGSRGKYSEQDLDQIAADYSAERHEAPVTVDHRQEGPALGWVRSLRRMGSLLIARLGGMAPEFVKQLRSGAFKKRSIEIYRANENAGKPYLKAVSFLGACAPVVKGLADPVFAESAEAAAIDFAEETIPAQCNEPEAAASPEPIAEFAQGDASSRIVQVDSHPSHDSHIAHSAAPAQFAEPDADTQAFCDELRGAGKIMPAWCDSGIAAFMSRLDDATPLRFSLDMQAPPVTLRAYFREFLQKLAPAVPMGEVAGASHLDESSAESFSLPQAGHGVMLDPDSISLHRRACLYRQANPRTSYAEALGAVVRM